MLKQKHNQLKDIADVLQYLENEKTELLSRGLDESLSVQNIAVQALYRQEVVDFIDRMITKIK